MRGQFHHIQAGEARRFRVSAPRPDSFMLRLRSLRQAGVMSLSPHGPAWGHAAPPGADELQALRDHLDPGYTA